MDGSLEQKLKNLAALDTEELGQLVRAKALKAVALHFMLQGVKEAAAQSATMGSDGGTGWSVRDGRLRRQDHG